MAVELEASSEGDMHTVSLEDEGIDAEEWPIPDLSEDDSERQTSIKQQKADESLASILRRVREDTVFRMAF